MENQNGGFSLFHEHETLGVIVILAIMIMSFLVFRINAESTTQGNSLQRIHEKEIILQSQP